MYDDPDLIALHRPGLDACAHEWHTSPNTKLSDPPMFERICNWCTRIELRRGRTPVAIRDHAELRALWAAWESHVAIAYRLPAVDPLLAVSVGTDQFRTTMHWPTEWGAAEFGALLATVVRHIAHNASLSEAEIMRETAAALHALGSEKIEGGRFQ